MKKRLLSFLLLLCLALAGCRHAESAFIPASPETLPEEVPTEESSDESIPEITDPAQLSEYLYILETPIHQYGESTAYISMEEDLVARLLYPVTEMPALDQSLETWIADTVKEYQEEALGSSQLGDSAELTAEYDSYLVEDRYVSVKITGLFDRPYIAHPVDLIATFHADLTTNQLLTLDDILLSDGRESLTEMVCEDASITEDSFNEHLLDLWVLTNEGLDIILQRGDYLPMSEGTVILSYTYEQLEGILSFRHEENTESAEEDSALTPEEPVTEAAVVTSIDPEKPMVALTFDDGPSKHTDRLLDIFASHGGKGTFFVVGNIIDQRADTLKRMAADGHEIAGHSWSHRQLTKLTTEDLVAQIMTTRAKIYEVTGVDSTLIRPPYGSYNDQVKQVCGDLGIVMANWSLDTLDWKYKDANRIYNSILKDVKDGDIILCHDLHQTTVDAMELVIPKLLEEGCQLVTVSELLSYSEKEIVPGGVYNRR